MGQHRPGKHKDTDDGCGTIIILALLVILLLAALGSSHVGRF